MASLDKSCQRRIFLGVKAVTVNISLNRELADFARADAEASAFDSMSEYMRELIRRRREARIAEDVAILEKAIAGAPARSAGKSSFPTNEMCPIGYGHSGVPK